jgi:hypothetical protein
MAANQNVLWLSFKLGLTLNTVAALSRDGCVLQTL